MQPELRHTNFTERFDGRIELHQALTPIPTRDSGLAGVGKIVRGRALVLRQWTEDTLGRCDVQSICTLQLPLGTYRMLQFALNNTTFTSNEVLAIQSKCPKALNLHDFYAFATLRSGNRLQWRNIARKLVPRVLNFSS